MGNEEKVYQVGISSTRPLRAIDITRHKKIEAS